MITLNNLFQRLNRRLTGLSLVVLGESKTMRLGQVTTIKTGERGRLHQAARTWKAKPASSIKLLPPDDLKRTVGPQDNFFASGARAIGGITQLDLILRAIHYGALPDIEERLILAALGVVPDSGIQKICRTAYERLEATLYTVQSAQTVYSTEGVITCEEHSHKRLRRPPGARHWDVNADDDKNTGQSRARMASPQ
ncbi:uncharacterized protein EI90DRAFT_3127925 [Cantharellus anzutake]|uniref:uncharacterized protein n=1 Tax=Cantharellus anzutake TaxID=1750568 RepID=UPI0019043476|nr:uncharacterized protein EI90DRAFT_3127925 [Cantharellus anzutake]KAF8326323.1 hypothetical protein EI90DRAFT_3127925 [Cantharellus anzutake]